MNINIKDFKCIKAVESKNQGLLMEQSFHILADAIKKWGMYDISAAEKSNGPAIVLSTFDNLPDTIKKNPTIAEAESIDPQGFVIDKVGKDLVITSKTARGVYNGAVYARDFMIKGTAEGLCVCCEPVVREPAMKGRPAYVVNIWGGDQLYTSEDWKVIFKAFAEEGIDRIYFWVSGHYPSKKFPQTYNCKDREWDSTVGTKTGTIKDLKDIIHHAHNLGLSIYLGGGLGAWCGTGLITNNATGTMKIGPGFASGSLCPSNPISRSSLIEYYTEMFDALPEADGMYIELADEWGECLCDECSKPLDEFGSKLFGRSQLTLAQEIAQSVWKNHSHANFAFTLGYDEHGSDPAFYEMVRQMDDPRYEWMEARGRWEFSGPEAKDMPAAYFSKHIMHWGQWYNRPLDDMITAANRAAASDFYGLITAFEPGFGSGSLYRQIPYPTNLLPYILTGFIYRELTWDPTLSIDQLRVLARQRFFDEDVSEELASELWILREFLRKSSGAKELSAEDEAYLAKLELDIEKAESAAHPKTMDTLNLMRTAIQDTREHFTNKSKQEV